MARLLVVPWSSARTYFVDMVQRPPFRSGAVLQVPCGYDIHTGAADVGQHDLPGADGCVQRDAVQRSHDLHDLFFGHRLRGLDRAARIAPALGPHRTGQDTGGVGQFFLAIGGTVGAKYNVLLTLKGNENRYAKLLYKQYSSLKTITFGGLLSYEEVYEKYNKIDCLIFPSKLETWGLPISEFMAFDKPMLIADLPYAHETAAGAKYVAFFNPDTPKMLADRMSEVINGDLFNFSSVPLVNIELPHVTSWKMLFDKLLVDND